MEGSGTRRLTADDWIAAAFAAFLKGGVEAVRVEALARTLQVTRGSFYWHFEDRPALLRALLGRWHRDETATIIKTVEAAGGAADERLLKLLETCARAEGHLELALRTWAASDPLAREAVAHADEDRRAYLADLLIEHGLEASLAAARARIAYAAWLGEYLQPEIPALQERLESMRALHQLLLASR